MAKHQHLKIVIEGPQGSGKTLTAIRIARWLAAVGHSCNVIEETDRIEYPAEISYGQTRSTVDIFVKQTTEG